MTRTEYVIALDPGQRTGYAIARMGVNEFHLADSGVLPAKDMALKLAEWQGIEGPMTRNRPRFLPRFNVMVWESWRPRRKNGKMDWIEGDRLLPAQHVGQIRLIAWMSGAKIVEQEPADKTPAVASLPPALDALDEESNEQHDQDARWHLWLYFFNNWFDPATAPENIDDVVTIG